MRKISEKTRKILIKDKFMKVCCLCNCYTRKIEWHHNLIYEGRQVDDPLSILPLCHECHENANDSLIKEELDFIMLVIRKLDIKKYPKSGLERRKNYLSKKFS